jgi:hypothetical protein
MKAKEAPEKLYFFEGEPILSARSKKREDANIEYTRTDAFIDNACEYFRRCLEDTKVIDDYRNILVRGIQASYTSVEEFIEDFKNYMKGN